MEAETVKAALSMQVLIKEKQLYLKLTTYFGIWNSGTKIQI